MVDASIGEQRAGSLASRWKVLEGTKTYDLLAVTPLIVWYAVCVTARLPALLQQIAGMQLIPRIMALGGTYLGVGIVLLPSIQLSARLYLTATLLIVSGTAFALYSALKLGRSISMMSEARRLVTCGPYALVRHPLYLGEGIALAGLTLQFLSPWAAVIFALQCACQMQRMKNEERVLLRAFPEYRNYMDRTARLVPHLY